MTREVYCNIVNLTSYTISSTTWHLDHGKPTMGPVSIPPGTTNMMQAFHFTKTEGSAYGVTGRVIYNLPDNSQLYLAFNCPFSQDGQGGLSNCFFYAGITNLPANTASTYFVSLQVAIGNSHPNAINPPNADSVTGSIILNN